LSLLLLYKVDDLTSHVKVEYEEDKIVPSARSWIAKKIFRPAYSSAEPLLYFLDKYTTIVAGGARALGKYYKNNRGKTLLDKLTVSDIAYSVLVYENSYDVWSEEIDKTKTCLTEEDKKLYQGTATNKYHVKRGARLPLYQDGWTNDGKQYFKELCAQFKAMTMNEELWTTLKNHWRTYTTKYHKYRYVERDDRSNEMESVSSEENGVNFDDDCVVSLPGELNDDGGMDVEDEVTEDDAEEDDSVDISFESNSRYNNNRTIKRRKV